MTTTRRWQDRADAIVSELLAGGRKISRLVLLRWPMAHLASLHWILPLGLLSALLLGYLGSTQFDISRGQSYASELLRADDIAKTYHDVSRRVEDTVARQKRAQEALELLADPDSAAPALEHEVVRARRAELQAEVRRTDVALAETRPLLVGIATSQGLTACELQDMRLDEASCANGALKRGWVMVAFLVTLAASLLAAAYWALLQLENSWILPYSNDRLWYSATYVVALGAIASGPFALIAAYYRRAARYPTPPEGWFLAHHQRVVCLLGLLVVAAALAAAVSVRVSARAITALIVSALVGGVVVLALSRGPVGWVLCALVVVGVVEYLERSRDVALAFATAWLVLAAPLAPAISVFTIDYVLERFIGVDNLVTTILRTGTLGLLLGHLLVSRRVESQVRTAVALGTTARTL